MGVKWEDMSEFMRQVILHCQKFASGYVVYCNKCRNPSSYEDYHYCTPCNNTTEFTSIPSRFADLWGLMAEGGESVEDTKDGILKLILDDLKVDP